MNSDIIKELKHGDWVKCVDPDIPAYGEVFRVLSHDWDDKLNRRVTVTRGTTTEICVLFYDTLEYFYEITPSPIQYTIIPNGEQIVLPNKAPDILKRAEEIMRERGKQYDQDDGERSMEKIVNTFNAATGHNLTEAQGWMFMIFLKLVRDNSRTEGHQDSCEDLVAYSSLYGESRLS